MPPSRTCQSLFGVFGCVLLGARNAHGLAQKIVVYQDAACSAGQEVAETTKFFALNTDENGEVLYGPFNECYELSSVSGVISICDATTGETGFAYYSDGACTDMTTEIITPTACTATGLECGEGQICAHTTTCVDDEPTTIAGTEFNWEAVQYTDSTCTDPTGVEEILPSEWGKSEYSNGCGNANLTDYAVQCEDGIMRTQSYDSEDSTCSGNVVVESVSYVINSTCITEPVDGYYYSLSSCTTEEATVVISAVADTPAPVAAEADTPAPMGTPVPSATIDTPEGTTTSAPEADSRGILETMSPTTAADDDSATPGAAPGSTPAPAEVVRSVTAGPTTAGGNDAGDDDASGAMTQYDQGLRVVVSVVSCAVAWLALGGRGRGLQ